MTVQNIEKQLLKLNTASRAKLANILLSSLDDLSDTENEKLWAEEAFRRHNDLSKGIAKLKRADIVFKNARNQLK